MCHCPGRRCEADLNQTSWVYWLDPEVGYRAGHRLGFWCSPSARAWDGFVSLPDLCRGCDPSWGPSTHGRRPQGLPLPLWKNDTGFASLFAAVQTAIITGAGTSYPLDTVRRRLCMLNMAFGDLAEAGSFTTAYPLDYARTHLAWDAGSTIFCSTA